MNKYDLSILIPARNEMFLAETVKSLLKSIRGNTEIIVFLDGQWAKPGVPRDERVTVVYSNVSIGQRAATNQACRLSKAKYVMKLDAHCVLDEGFDVKMMAEMQDDYTLIPTMYNLHAFDWICIGSKQRSGKEYEKEEDLKKLGCGHRIYQGPTPDKCPNCSGHMERLLVWKPRMNRKSTFYRFDKTLHFQYWGDFANRPEAQSDVAPTLSAQGSCFMLTRAKYWELDICDERHGSWGQQGVEVACKTWLSGGKLMVNKKTWYSHMFRTQGGDFGFPYELSGKQVDQARKYSRDLWIGGNWPKAIHSLDWLLKKFAPVPDWDNSDNIKKMNESVVPQNKKPTKGVIYYTDNELDDNLSKVCQKQLLKGIKEKHIVSSSLKPISFGKNITVDGKRGYLTMAIQILKALEASTADIIFFAEHDVLYHPSHFDFIPPDKNTVYYDTNVIRVRAEDGHALITEDLKQLSGLVGYRETLINHYRERVGLLGSANVTLSEEDFKRYVRRMGFEPGTHNRAERVDNLKSESYHAEYPNIDIRHGKNLTPSRWNRDQFKNPKFTEGWFEPTVINGWGKDNGGFIIKDHFSDLIASI